MLLYPAYSQDVEHYVVAKVNTELVIDGLLDEGVWIKAAPTTNFVILGNNKEAKSN